jgi:hypothetical protein
MNSNKFSEFPGGSIKSAKGIFPEKIKYPPINTIRSSPAASINVAITLNLADSFIPKKLMENIYDKGVKNINILLDKDAQEIALYYTVQFQNQGITTRNIIPSDKDAGEMGFSKINKILKESKETSFDDVIKQKLFNL